MGTKFVKLTDRKVLNLRRRFTRANGALTIEQLSRKTGIGADRLSQILRGVRFSHVPEAVVMTPKGPPRVVTDEVALFMRLIYHSPTVSAQMIARAHNVSGRTAERIISGAIYKDVPEAHTKMKPARVPKAVIAANALQRRKFTLEVALFMRLAYNPPKVTVTTLAKAYDADIDTIRQLLTGQRYQEAPCAIPTLHGRFDLFRRLRPEPDLTDEIVIAMRRFYALGMRPHTMIAEQIDMSRRACLDMLKGVTYGHLPGAVPVPPACFDPKRRYRSGAKRRKRPEVKPKLIKAIPPRLVDHDLKADAVAYREAIERDWEKAGDIAA